MGLCRAQPPPAGRIGHRQEGSAPHNPHRQPRPPGQASTVRQPGQAVARRPTPPHRQLGQAAARWLTFHHLDPACGLHLPGPAALLAAPPCDCTAGGPSAAMRPLLLLMPAQGWVVLGAGRLSRRTPPPPRRAHASGTPARAGCLFEGGQPCAHLAVGQGKGKGRARGPTSEELLAAGLQRASGGASRGSVHPRLPLLPCPDAERHRELDRGRRGLGAGARPGLLQLLSQLLKLKT